MARKKKDSTAGSSSLAGLSVAELQRELRRRHGRVGALQRRREKLVNKLREIEAKLTEAGGLGAGGRVRFKNDKNLVEALVEVLKGKTMGVTEVSEAVQKAGYRTSSPSFRTIVNQTLINSGKFSRVERGQYTAK